MKGIYLDSQDWRRSGIYDLYEALKYNNIVNSQMNRSARVWLLFMMVPFLIGVLIHFLVPLQFIITSNPKIEEAYNSYKIEVEQNTVRALAFLNSKVANNRMQMYENIRSTFIRLFDRGRNIQPIDVNKVVLNNARDISSMRDQQMSEQMQRKSMWYSPTAANISDFNTIQRQIYDEYARVQPFIQSIYNNRDEVYRGLLYLQTTVNYQNQQFYFRYPSNANSTLNQPNVNLTDYFYLKTIINYEEESHSQTIFDLFQSLKNCIPLLDDSQQIIATVCLGLEITSFVQDITTSLSVPEFELSTNDYYLVRPLYTFSSQNSPQIIANFSNDNLTHVEIPKQKYFSLEQNQLSPTLFDGKIDYQLNIQRLDRTKTYYTIPIPTYNYLDIYSISMYLIVVNNFAKAEIQEESHYQQILTLMIVPSIILLIISIFVTTFVLKSMLNQLDTALTKLSDYCLLIIKGDLDLQIPEYEGTSDLNKLFKQFSRLNEINKYSQPKYFQGSKPQRLIKYFKCQQLFDQLQYNKSNLYENISDCYFSMEEYVNAKKYIVKSIFEEKKTFFDELGQVDGVYQRKLAKCWKYDKKYKAKEKVLKRKIIKFIKVIYYGYDSSRGSEGSKEMDLALQKLRKLTYPRILNNQYISGCIFKARYRYRNKDFSTMKVDLEYITELVNEYEQLYGDSPSKNEECWMHPDIMRSYLNFLYASWNAKNNNYIEAFDYYVASLSGNYYNPSSHFIAFEELSSLLKIHDIDSSCLKNLKFRQQEIPRDDREYIFLIDVSNPNLKYDQISNWKKKCRDMADFILRNFVLPNDRMCINEFCKDIRVLCNLVKMESQQKIMRRQLLAAFKYRQNVIYSQLVQNLQKCIDRVKHLLKQKVFIVFLKGGYDIHGRDINRLVQDTPNSIFIFFVENRNIVKEQQQSFYVVSMEDKEDVERILEKKQVKKAQNTIYIL